MTPVAARQRKHRERQRNGLIVLAVEVDEVDVAEALIVAGFLSSDHNRDALTRSLEDVIRLWRKA